MRDHHFFVYIILDSGGYEVVVFGIARELLVINFCDHELFLASL